MCSIGVAGVPSGAFAKAQSFEMAGPARLAAPSTPAPFRNVRRFSVVMGSSSLACRPRGPAVTPPVYLIRVDRRRGGSERRMDEGFASDADTLTTHPRGGWVVEPDAWKRFSSAA